MQCALNKCWRGTAAWELQGPAVLTAGNTLPFSVCCTAQSGERVRLLGFVSKTGIFRKYWGEKNLRSCHSWKKIKVWEFCILNHRQTPFACTHWMWKHKLSLVNVYMKRKFSTRNKSKFYLISCFNQICFIGVNSLPWQFLLTKKEQIQL